MPHRNLSLDELADYLHLDGEAIRLLVRRGEIPHEKIGSQLRFSRNEIDAWASQRLLGMKEGERREFHRRSTLKEHVLGGNHAVVPELMKPSHIEPELSGKTKAKVIRNMVDLADRTGLLYGKEDLLEGVERREAMNSTALSGGIALLHPPHHDPYMFEDSFLVLGRTAAPIHFGGPDGIATDLFFLVCGQEDRIHLHLLARLSMICYHTAALISLRDAATAGDMFDVLVAAEEEIIQAHQAKAGHRP